MRSVRNGDVPARTADSEVVDVPDEHARIAHGSRIRSVDHELGAWMQSQRVREENESD